MYIDQIIFSKFRGKYEKIKIIYVKSKILKSHTFFSYTWVPLKNICENCKTTILDYGFKENYKTTIRDYSFNENYKATICECDFYNIFKTTVTNCGFMIILIKKYFKNNIKIIIQLK